MNSSANRTLERIPMGQPILTDHYSAIGHRNLIARAQKNIRKSIQEDKKSDFYSNRAESVENSKAIYGDDPDALKKEDVIRKCKNGEDGIHFVFNPFIAHCSRRVPKGLYKEFITSKWRDYSDKG